MDGPAPKDPDPAGNPLGELARVVARDENLKAAGRELGEAVRTITKVINVALLPVAAVSFGIDKARRYFKTRFPKEMAQKASKIPAGDVVAPKASIAGPALQGLAFSHEEPDLKEMYLHLLATAMDGRRTERAHPAFVEILRQLSAAEAPLLREVLRKDYLFPVVEVRRTHRSNPRFELLRRHLLNLRDTPGGAPLEDDRVSLWVENWARLGLVEVDYTKFKDAPGAYEVFEDRPEVARAREAQGDPAFRVTLQRGILSRTTMGSEFAVVVGLADAPRGASATPSSKRSAPKS